MIRTLPLFSMISFLLVGCVPLYKAPPPESYIAKARFVSKVDLGIKNIDVFFFDSQKDLCQFDVNKSQIVASLNGIRVTHNRQDLSMPLGESFSPKSKTEVEVRANQPLYFAIGTVAHNVCLASVGTCIYGGSCLIRANFTPKENHMYEITYDTDSKQCISQTFEIKSESFTYERVVEPSAVQVTCDATP